MTKIQASKNQIRYIIRDLDTMMFLAFAERLTDGDRVTSIYLKTDPCNADSFLTKGHLYAFLGQRRTSLDEFNYELIKIEHTIHITQIIEP